MEPITLRLPSELLEELDSEAEDAGFSSRSEYIRHLLLNRDQLSQLLTSDIDPATYRGDSSDLEPTVDDLVGQISEMRDRLDQVESEVEDLQASSEQDEEQLTTLSVDTEADSTKQSQESNDASSQSESDEDSESDSESGGEAVQSDPGEEVFTLLGDWLETNGPQKEVVQEIMIEAAKILAEDGPLRTGEIRDELVDRYPDAYESADGLWHSTVGRLQDETPGFGRPEYGTYDFDAEQLQRQME
jgi:Arc/MetJ-type ribon-helix-helix transcriptional regulator